MKANPVLALIRSLERQGFGEGAVAETVLTQATSVADLYERAATLHAAGNTLARRVLSEFIVGAGTVN